MKVSLLHGDCVVRMVVLPRASVEAICADPPYGLEFMGKDWDAPWKYTINSHGFTDGADRLPAPSFTSSRNPTCQECGKRKRTWKTGPPACSCPAPRFDDVDHRARDMRAFQQWSAHWLTEARRVLVPGGVIKVFGGTRVFHRVAAAMAAVGFEDIGLTAWTYGSGFPKSLAVGRAIDKLGGRHGETLRAFRAYVDTMRQERGLSNREIDEALGLQSGGSSACHWTTHPTQPRFPREHLYVQLKVLLGLDGRFDEAIKEVERAVIGIRSDGFKSGSGTSYGQRGGWQSRDVSVTAPGSEAAARWEGWGTALKPAWEPVLVGRKPC